MDGLILLLVMGLFFLSMYLYAYGTTNYAAKKEEKLRQKKLLEAKEKEEKLKADMLERQKQRDEKYRLANERSQEIQKEIERLSKLKEQREKIEA
jgi:cbb3-type cytochrome oxidase subunit 3